MELAMQSERVVKQWQLVGGRGRDRQLSELIASIFAPAED